MRGPVVRGLQGAFAEHWLEATGEVLSGEDYLPHMFGPAGYTILRKPSELPARLHALSMYMRSGLKSRGIAIRDSETPIIPIYTYDVFTTLETAKALYDEGVYVNPVLPPATPATECLLRTSYMATHTEALLDEALDVIERVVKAHVK